ncbi:MAG: AraC family transcriptional regulator [Cyanobacteria bacterium P01_F01_bin.150]
MTISLTFDEYYEQFEEENIKELQFDPFDDLDFTRKHDNRLGKGWVRDIQLRDDIWIKIAKEKSRDRVVISSSEEEGAIHWHFFLSGKQQYIHKLVHKETCFPITSGTHAVFGYGLAAPMVEDCSDKEPFLEINIEVPPEVLRSFISSPDRELPDTFNHLVRPFDQERYTRVGKTQLVMNTALQQILQCPYQGMTKRIYLESKVIELMSLMLEEEVKLQQGETKKFLLSSEYQERIHYAQEILLNNLDNPPSLMELARQVGICDYNLKRGFREVFNTTVFGYLRDRRLEKAQQLLLDGQMKVASVARAVGYNSPTSFNAAFKRKFGVSPKAYQLSARQ